MAYAAPPPGYLPTTRTEAVNPFRVIGVDYASPLRYRILRQREIKGYVLLNACSLTKGSTWISYQAWKQMSAWGSSLGSEGDWSESIPTMIEYLLVLWSGSGQWWKTYYLSVNQIKWLIGLIKISPTQVSGEWYVELEGIGRCCSRIALCCQSYNLTVLKRLTFANEPTTCLSARRRCGDVVVCSSNCSGKRSYYRWPCYGTNGRKEQRVMAAKRSLRPHSFYWCSSQRSRIALRDVPHRTGSPTFASLRAFVW